MLNVSVKRPMKVVVVGAGHRSLAYAGYALQNPNLMKVVAVADPDVDRRRKVTELHGLSSDMAFDSYEQLTTRPRIGDAIINGTMDKLHYQSTMPLLEHGYDVLLEKPIAPTEQEVRDLIKSARRYERLVMICHVLRYTPFYQAVKRVVDEGQIGQIIAMHTSENVSYHHMACGFVRGKWSKAEHATPMILAKCCHDLDLIAWLASGHAVKRVASFGSLMHFRPENAPQGAATRCLNGCTIEPQCQYSAKAHYINSDHWGTYAWGDLNQEHLSKDEKIKSLQTTNPYGRCVWHCDNDVVDHQSVIVEFDNGMTASHNMLCATARPTRTIHLVGTKGELQGDFVDGTMTVSHPITGPDTVLTEHHYHTQTIDVNVHDASEAMGHGGGDQRLTADFVATWHGQSTSSGVSRIEDSLTGHLIAFAAEKARTSGTVVDFANP